MTFSSLESLFREFYEVSALSSGTCVVWVTFSRLKQFLGGNEGVPEIEFSKGN